MNYKFKIILAIFVIFVCFLLVNIENIQAGSVSDLLQEAGTQAQYDISEEGTSLPALVGKIIRAFLSLLGVFFMGLAVYAGYLWMNARGDAEQVKKAQDILRDAVIGLVIVIAAYAVTYFVLFYIAKDYTTSSGF